jgi:hypothetical protein
MMMMIMRIGRKHIAALLGAAAVTAAIAAAPVAGAAPAGAQEPDQPQQTCVQPGASAYECEAPGNVQVNDPPSADDYYSILG